MLTRTAMNAAHDAGWAACFFGLIHTWVPAGLLGVALVACWSVWRLIHPRAAGNDAHTTPDTQSATTHIGGGIRS